ncbi:methyltransferase domain-containing protein [bacterium]|nr:methyltransferase domain-containing protein [bacterium]
MHSSHASAYNFKTAHQIWDRRGQTDKGRQDGLTPESDVESILHTLQSQQAQTVLDLGCGVGRHALLLAENGFTTHGVDYSVNGLQEAGQTAQKKDLTLHLNAGDMTDLPYRDASFDYVLAWNVIYHGEPKDLKQAITEIHRVLRPGGLFQGTFLTKTNTNFGQGTKVAKDTYVHGLSEKSSPHCDCNAEEACRRLAAFNLLSLYQREHTKPGSHHWHFIAQKP